ncbi:glycosyltransferase family 4 protein [Ferrimonas balearica]|uniref:glycosyltransferase family 4 protein n=1 Tax=Ferrimonas balearica TaxID=44012 RepID=UPI001C997A9C|nr:glycosyltransferase family 4 protein [Ferrimonas balearica]MBY5923318.1 glycosyltransferase family 4 protein [Ferrimonas balearica]MBY5995276.1 glycosyltransferase family 4 protein [Ferrimonas balearica]
MSHVPKVLLLDLSAQFGGASSRVLGLLARYPDQHAVLGALTDSPVYREARAQGLPVVGLGRHKADPRLLGRLCRFCRAQGIELIDSHNIQSQFWAHWTSRRCGIAHVSTLNSWYALEYRQHWRAQLYPWLANALRPDGPLIVVSDAIRQALLAEGVESNRIHLIPNAMAPTPTMAVSRAELAQRYGLDPNRPWLLTVARLEAAKRVDRYLDAVSQLPQVQGIVVGDGHLRAQLAETVQTQALPVVMTGALPYGETQALMAASDLLMLSSDTEGTPLVLLEGAALAKPMVATAVGGIPELFQHDEHALLMPTDAMALAAAVRDLLADPGKAERLGHAAQVRLRERFSPEQQLSQTLSAYRAALESPL